MAASSVGRGFMSVENRSVVRGGLALLAAVMAAGTARAQSAPAVAAPSLAPSGGTANGVGSQFELVFWQSVAASEDRAQIETYLQQFPNGTFSALAKAKINALDRREAAARGIAIPPPPTPTASSETSAAAMPAPVAPPASVTAAVPPPPAAAVAQTATSPAPQPAVAIAPAAPAIPAAAAPANGAVSLASMAEQLGALGRSQGQHAEERPAAANVQPTPARPALASVSPLALPDHFCTAMDRNSYYDAVYKPAKDQVDQNNRSAIAYLDELKTAYDRYGSGNDTAGMNRLAKESWDYQSVAKAAYQQSVEFDGLFGKLMAVPLGKCP